MDEYGLTKELYSNHRVIQRMEPVVRLSNDQNEVQEAKNKIEELIGRNQQIRTDIVALNSNVGARLATSFLIEQFNKFIERAGRYGDAVFITKDQASSTGSMLYYQVIKRLHRIVKGEQIGVSDIELRFKEDKNDAVSVPDFVYFMREEKLILTHQDIGDVTFVSLEQYFFEASDRLREKLV